MSNKVVYFNYLVSSSTPPVFFRMIYSFANPFFSSYFHHSQSTDSAQSTISNNSSSNVIVVCIGNRTKCFTTSNNNTAKSPASPSPASPNPSSSSPNHFTYKTSTTNSKLNHNVVNESESNGNRINCQMNNLLEEDEDELEREKIDEVGKELQANGAHLSAEILKENDQNLNGSFKEPPQNLLSHRVNGFKTETCI
jgi:hypothetical protein